jgi:HPt (histidine-containing phosphotransfer) domain-containing protein
MKGDEEKCLEVGMDGYISKPVNQGRLFHALWQLLRTRQSLPERAADGAPAGLESAPGELAETDTVDAPRAGSTPETGAILADKLPGIDIGETLAALDMDAHTLRRIMMGFLAHNRDMVEKLRAAFSAEDPGSMRQLAHGLKGSAANIGAADLSRAAHRLEAACGEALSADTALKTAELEGLIEKVASALNLVFASIQSLGEAGPGDADAGAKAPGETDLPFEALLDRLAEAVDRADPTQIMEIMPAVRQRATRCRLMDPSTLGNLEKQIDRYDYDQALETIRKMRNRQRGTS